MMALTIRDYVVGNDFDEKIKQFTGFKTSTKALLSAANSALSLRSERDELQEQVNTQSDEIQRLESVIEELDGLCAQVRQITGQGAFKL